MEDWSQVCFKNRWIYWQNYYHMVNTWYICISSFALVCHNAWHKAFIRGQHFLDSYSQRVQLMIGLTYAQSATHDDICVLACEPVKSRLLCNLCLKIISSPPCWSNACWQVIYFLQINLSPEVFRAFPSGVSIWKPDSMSHEEDIYSGLSIISTRTTLEIKILPLRFMFCLSPTNWDSESTDHVLYLCL